MTGFMGNAGNNQQMQMVMIPIQPSPSGDGSEWSNQETRELMEIRAELEWAFAQGNMNSTLWELVAERIRDKGYTRTAHHCRFKWENLVHGCQTQGQESFFNAVFDERATGMQQSQVEVEAEAEAEAGVGRGGKRLNDGLEDQSCEDFIQEQEDEEEIEVVNHGAGKGREVVPEQKAVGDKRRKMKQNGDYSSIPATNVNTLHEIMRSFSKQQQMIDMEWRAAMERRAEERERLEQEWRQRMEKLEREALMMEQAWREKEEERKEREERRAEQRDALVTALLNQLVDEGTP